MIKFLLSLLLLTNLAHSCADDYTLCQNKLKDSHSLKYRYSYIPINDNKLIGFSREFNSKSMQKYDPFLGLFILKKRSTFEYPFYTKGEFNPPVSLVGKDRAIKGKVSKSQVGLNRLASFSKKSVPYTLLLSNCCVLEGLVTDRGIIQKPYINNFLKNKEVSYGDIGIRLKQSSTNVIVASTDPFFTNNQFVVGDQILKINGKNIESSSLLMQKILFSTQGKSIVFNIKRANKIKKIKVKVGNRYGGGLISDTFLERHGLFFDNELLIKESDSSRRLGLSVSDKLVSVNLKNVSSYSDIREVLSGLKEEVKLLFERDGFMFFIILKI